MGQKYRILSFNIQKMGRNNTKDFEKISNIIKNDGTPFDIVAIQEVTNYQPLRQLMSYLEFVKDDIVNPSPVDCRESYGFESDNWGARWAKPVSKYDSAIAEEGYAFIWNKRTVSLSESKEGQKFEPRILNQYKKSKYGRKLLRQPFYGRFSMNNCSGEIRVINTHVIFSKTSKDLADESFSELSDVKLRNEEHRILCETIYPKIDDKTFDYVLHDADYEMRSVYTFIVGDYNLNLKSSKAKGNFIDEDCIEIIDGNSRKRIVTKQNELTTLKKSIISDMPDIEEKWMANNYDHSSFDEIRFNKIGISPVVERLYNVVDYKNDNERDKYRKTISDHLPIVVTLNISSSVDRG